MVSRRILPQAVPALVGKRTFHYQQRRCHQKDEVAMISKDELHEFEHSIFTGITVGIGSMILLFSSSTRVLIQCPFLCGRNERSHLGHGENIETSNLLFPLLNHEVKNCSLVGNKRLNLCFDDGSYICITPENNGLESYVITTSQGNYPIITY